MEGEQRDEMKRHLLGVVAEGVRGGDWVVSVLSWRGVVGVGEAHCLVHRWVRASYGMAGWEAGARGSLVEAEVVVVFRVVDSREKIGIGGGGRKMQGA